MTGQFYLDGIDAYTSLGICVTKGSYNNLVAFPAIKELEKNDWPEEDGQEFDLSNIALNTSDISIEFAYMGSMGIGGLIDKLSDLSYHEFRFPLIDRTYTLRLSSQNSYVINTGLEISKFTLTNDFPREANYEYQEPINDSDLPFPKGYELDGKDLTDYGVVVLKGSTAEILKTPAVKKNLLQNFKRQDGAIYDGEVVKFQTKEVSLKCLMRAGTIEAMPYSMILQNCLLRSMMKDMSILMLNVYFIVMSGVKATLAIIRVARQTIFFLIMGYGGNLP